MFYRVWLKMSLWALRRKVVELFSGFPLLSNLIVFRLSILLFEMLYNRLLDSWLENTEWITLSSILPDTSDALRLVVESWLSWTLYLTKLFIVLLYVNSLFSLIIIFLILSRYKAISKAIYPTKNIISL